MQFAALANHVALYHRWKNVNHFSPDIIIGYGLGESASIVCGGCISYENMIKIMAAQAAISSENLKRKFVESFEVRGLPFAKVEEMCKEKEEYGNAGVSYYHTPDYTEVIGEKNAMKELANLIIKNEGEIIYGHHGIDAHSLLFESVYQEFRCMLDDYPIQTPQAVILSGLTGNAIANARLVKENLACQFVYPASFIKIAKSLKRMRLGIIAITGGSGYLDTFLQDNGIRCKTYGTEAEEEISSSVFRHSTVDSKEIIERCLYYMATTKNQSPFDEKIQKCISETYNAVKAIWQQTIYDSDHADRTISYLRNNLEYKGYGASFVDHVINRIHDETVGSEYE